MELAKRESILHAATRAFAKAGFKKASIEEIAKDAGVAKGTVYLACESKEDLFYQSVHREVRAWVAEIATLLDRRVAADDLLVRITAASIDQLDRHPLVRDLLLGHYHGQLPGWSERLEELRELCSHNGIEILKLGVKQGRFRADLDVEETAMLLQDMHITGLMWALRLKLPAKELAARFERRAAAGLALILDGLRPR
jgi:TetR/AcrR family fatty acid metabolism transcriptional regulator